MSNQDIKVNTVTLPLGSARNSSPPQEENIYRIKRGGHRIKLAEELGEMLDSGFMTDVTLACEGRFIRAHKIVLAAASPFFKEYFETYRTRDDGMVVLTNMKFDHLQTLINFIYHGKGSVKKEEIHNFVDTARTLKIDGYVIGLGSGPHTSFLTSSQPARNEATIPAFQAPSYSSVLRRNSNATTATATTTTTTPPIIRQSTVASTSTETTGTGAPAIKRPRTSSLSPPRPSSSTSSTSSEFPTTSNRASASRNQNFPGTSEPRIKLEFQGSRHNISVKIKEEPKDDDDIQVIDPPRSISTEDPRLRVRFHLSDRGTHTLARSQIRESRRYMLRFLDALQASSEPSPSPPRPT